MNVAPKSSAPVSIDDDVEFLTEQLKRLKELGAQNQDRDQMSDEDVYDLSVRWGTALAGRLARMSHYNSCGLLADADQRRFQPLCDELRQVSPLIARFKLTRPDSRIARTRVPAAGASGRSAQRNGSACCVRENS